MIRPEIQELIELGPLPSEDEAEVEQLNRYEALLRAIERPVTDEEAKALARLFGPDDCYGGAWVLLHLIETAPSWPIEEVLPADSENEWIRRMRRRAQNAGLLGGGAPGADA